MDIMLTNDGDLYVSKKGDILLADSVAQKIKIRLKWFEGEWRWNQDQGLPYMENLLIKNPDLDYFESAIMEKIFEVDEVTEVSGVSISFDSKTRQAMINFCAKTDRETIKGEVKIQCQITE